jgi:hypothetical protein
LFKKKCRRYRFLAKIVKEAELRIVEPCINFNKGGKKVVPPPPQNGYLFFHKIKKSNELFKHLQPKERKEEIDKLWRELSVKDKSSYRCQANQGTFEFDLDSIPPEERRSKLNDILKRKTADETVQVTRCSKPKKRLSSSQRKRKAAEKSEERQLVKRLVLGN